MITFEMIDYNSHQIIIDFPTLEEGRLYAKENEFDIIHEIDVDNPLINKENLHRLMKHFGADFYIDENCEIMVSYYGGGSSILHITCLCDKDVLETIIHDLQSRLKGRRN